MKATIYNTKAKETGSIELPEAIFGQKWNTDLVHEVVTSMMSNARVSIADTKGRGEVRGGGKKPWKQKGTGRARHGSRRSPIWRGGGVTHGPLAEKDYSKKINKKARSKALAVVLSKKFADGEIVFLDGFSFSVPKAKEAREALVALSSVKGVESLKGKRKNAALIALPSRDANVEKSFRNFGNITVAQTRDINPVELLNSKYLIVVDPKVSIEALASRITPQEKKIAK